VVAEPPPFLGGAHYNQQPLTKEEKKKPSNHPRKDYQRYEKYDGGNIKKIAIHSLGKEQKTRGKL